MTPTKSAPPPTLTSPDQVREWLEESRQARLSSGEATRLRVEAERDLEHAERTRDHRREDRLVGKGNAKLEAAADEAVTAARMRIVRAASDEAAALALIRQRQTLIAQRRERDYDPFAEEASARLPECDEARAKLVEAAEQFAAIYNGIAGEWNTLAPATAHRATKLEGDGGILRDDKTISRDSYPPDCPITPALLAELRTASPKPPILAPDYYSKLGFAEFMEGD